MKFTQGYNLSFDMFSFSKYDDRNFENFYGFPRIKNDVIFIFSDGDIAIYTKDEQRLVDELNTYDIDDIKNIDNVEEIFITSNGCGNFMAIIRFKDISIVTDEYVHNMVDELSNFFYESETLYDLVMACEEAEEDL